MIKIGTNMALEEPFAAPSHFPLTVQAIEQNLEQLCRLARSTASNVYYADLIDFLFCEVFGNESRELCQSFYFEQGVKLDEILSENEIRKADLLLSFSVKERLSLAQGGTEQQRMRRLQVAVLAKAPKSIRRKMQTARLSALHND
jgi:hypothetical protein